MTDPTLETVLLRMVDEDPGVPEDVLVVRFIRAAVALDMADEASRVRDLVGDLVTDGRLVQTFECGISRLFPRGGSRG